MEISVDRYRRVEPAQLGSCEHGLVISSRLAASAAASVVESSSRVRSVAWAGALGCCRRDSATVPVMASGFDPQGCQIIFPTQVAMMLCGSGAVWGDEGLWNKRCNS
ncbi:hypothetical protein [Virgisporangium ochraceum]|uniref:hypothetical protein n=1 Tax=Virgisporangium ochraceum TaxID=65505 RepID=UPI001944A92B|nr:hypothetical protein [Virgisporangium ochraceum]